jgi:short subunit dehydrogenase-like uncharacterized protein
MLYGANGYTGRLIAHEANRLGLAPVLAGRRGRKVEALGRKLGMETCVFPLDSPNDVEQCLRDVKVVLNCAGPFIATTVQMLAGCVAVGTHYLDVSGEIPVLEYIHSRPNEWRAAGIVVIPGVGANVVATDCLAAMLKQELPDAAYLRVAVGWPQKVSPGTAMSMLETIPEEGRVRIDGVIQRVPNAFKTAIIPFADGPAAAVTGPIGDVCTAYYSTGIKNIEAYVAMPARQLRRAKPPQFVLRLLRRNGFQGVIKGLIRHAVKGPGVRQRATEKSQYWAEVVNEAGQKVAATLMGRDAYTLTADAAVECVRRVLTENLPPGPFTPASAFGAGFVNALPEVEVTIRSS